jgi:hypothetical protein
LSDVVNDSVARYLDSDFEAVDDPVRVITSGDPKLSRPAWEEIEGLLESGEIVALYPLHST